MVVHVEFFERIFHILWLEAYRLEGHRHPCLLDLVDWLLDCQLVHEDTGDLLLLFITVNFVFFGD